MIEYVAGTKSGLVQPLTKKELDDMPHAWVEKMWVVHEVGQELEKEQMDAGTKQTTRNATPTSMEESLAGMSQIGM